ncbi:MAG: hypothetical protein QM607_03260 [Microbacterium sp.]
MDDTNMVVDPNTGLMRLRTMEQGVGEDEAAQARDLVQSTDFVFRNNFGTLRGALEANGVDAAPARVAALAGAYRMWGVDTDEATRQRPRRQRPRRRR